MTETFTFKPSPLMPLRLRLVNAEIKRKLKWLDRYSATDEAGLSETDLRLTTQSLYHKVAMLWKNFGVTPNLLLTDGFFWEVDELPIIYLLSFKLNQEFKHYDRMLRREEAAGERKINRVHRLLPSWIKSDERYERAKQRWNKEGWKTSWVDKYFPVDLPLGAMTDSFLYAAIGVLILAMVIASGLYIVFYKDQILNSIAQVLVDQSIQSGFSFSQVYAGLGAGLMIAAFLFVSIFYIVRLFNQEVDHTPEALAEIAYKVEHPASPATNGEPGSSGIVS